MSTYYEKLQKQIDEFKRRLDSSFLELRSLYIARRSFNPENYKKEETRIKNEIDNLVDQIDNNKDLLATYKLVSNYTEDVKILTKMYSEENNIKIRDEISNELSSKRDFINNRLNNIPEDISKELRENYLEVTSKIEDSKVNNLENEKTKLLKVLNNAKRKKEESAQNMMNIFAEERFIMETEGPFSTNKELDDFYEKYLNKKIEENKILEKAKKQQEILEKKLKILDTRIKDRREAISTANKLNINVDDYEKILTRIKKRDYVTGLFESLGLTELVDLRKKAIYPNKEELAKYREIIKERLIEEKINQANRASVKALSPQVSVKELLPVVVDKNKNNYLPVISNLREGLDKSSNNRNIATNIHVNNDFKKELHNRDNNYNVIHVTPEISKLPVPVVRQLSANILNRDTAKEKLKIVKERLDNLSERELLILYKQYGKHNEEEKFTTGINTLIRERITRYVNDKEKEINEDLDKRYTEVFNCVRELDTINILLSNKKISNERKEELEKYKETLIKGKSKTILNIRKDYEDAKLLFRNGSNIINQNINNRFLKNHELDVEVLEKEQSIIKAERQAVKDNNDEMALRCFVEAEKLLVKNINKEQIINSSMNTNKKYYSPIAEKLDYKNDSLIRDIYKTVVEIGTNLNTNNLLNNNSKYLETKKEVLNIVNDYAKGLLSKNDVINEIDKLNIKTKEESFEKEETNIKQLEEYKQNNSNFNLDKTINTINYLVDNPSVISENKLTKDQSNIIYNIPEKTRNSIIDTISTNTLTNTLKTVLKDNKSKAINNINDLLNDYINYQKEETERKIK